MTTSPAEDATSSTTPKTEGEADTPITPGLAGSPETDGTGATADAALITAATYISQGMLFVAGLVSKGLLGPLGTGYWALMQAFWSYFSILTLGASAGGGRQIPLRRGRRDYFGAARAASTGATFSIVALAVGGVVIAAVALIFGGGWAPEIRYGLVVLALIAPLRMLDNAHELILSSTRRFRALALGTVLKGVIAISVQTVAVALFGFWGMFVGVVVTVLAVLALWTRMGLTGIRRPAFVPQLDRAMLRELIAYGAPILVWGQLWLLFTGIDNILVAGLIDVENLGYYALAVSVTSYILLMPRSVGQVLSPRMSEEFGRTGDLTSLRGYAVDAQRLLAHMLVPLFLATVFFLLPVLVRQALPEFEPAIPVVRIMAAGSFFLSLTNMPIKTMITAGRRLPLILLLIPCLAVNVGGNLLAIEVFDAGIEGAAVATSFSYLFVFVLTGEYALSKVIGRRHTALHLAELLVVVAYVMAVVWGIEVLIGPGGESLVSQTLVALAKLALSIAAFTPLLIRSQRLDRGPSRMLGLVRDGAASTWRVLDRGRS